MWPDDRSRKPVGALDYAVVTLTPGTAREGPLLDKGRGLNFESNIHVRMESLEVKVQQFETYINI